MIVFCTTCKGRLQHLRETLPKNLADNPRSKFVVLDYGDDSGLFDYLRSAHGAEIHKGRLAVYRHGAETFKMAHAKNMAHRLGIIEGADILVNLDADNFTGERFEDYVEEQFQFWNGPAGRGVDIFLWGDMVKGEMARGINGRIAVTKNAFLKAGGYDEKFETWSPDDKDFNQRLRSLGYVGISIDRRYLEAIRHTDKMRFREYPHVAEGHSYDEPAPWKLHEKTCVANAGQVGCGLVYRCFDNGDLFRLAPIATRIFGVGMQKTATTSLHHAFEILGYDSAHWRSAPWAKRIWQEMNSAGLSNTLERSYALCDIPIPNLFRQLDQAYPGSKFVLTLREENAWLDSVRKHWDPAFNKFRAKWDVDPFSHRIHKNTYGQSDFEPRVFLERYRAHNAAVIEHFRGRPHDLLVMDMDNGGDASHWWKLCAFLGVPLPGVDYPRSYAAY